MAAALAVPRATITSFVDLLACPKCRGALESARDGGREALRCMACAELYPIFGGIAALRVNAEDRTEKVRDFYMESPFPNYPPNDTLSGLRGRAARSEFARLLDDAVPGDANIVEIGCGTGQMSLFLATADRRILGADLTRASLELAHSASVRYDLPSAQFIETDLRQPGLREGAFDVVYSSGVLHHTPDPRASFKSMAKLARPGGMVVLGLYNAYARFPHRLRRGVARLTGFRFIPLDPVLRSREAEPERRKAWFRDQYQHPEEHRHTVAEVQRWFRENDIDYVRTYPDALIGAEPLGRGELFMPSEDDWGLENVLSQIGWSASLGHEGGLWVTVGRKREQ
ncbi:MAG TPA: methyltransferase domain-containing protein [Polyangiaceae bacterium]|jgi:SAM-dependent methyltransferase